MSQFEKRLRSREGKAVQDQDVNSGNKTSRFWQAVNTKKSAGQRSIMQFRHSIYGTFWTETDLNWNIYEALPH